MERNFFLVELLVFSYGDSYLEFIFCHSKVFVLHAVIDDATEVVRSHSGKGRGYCSIIGQGQKSLLFSNVTGLLFCLCVKSFRPSVINSVKFRNSSSCIVLDIELADKNVLMDLGDSIDGRVLGYSFRNPKRYTATKQALCCTRNLHGIVWKSGN